MKNQFLCIVIIFQLITAGCSHSTGKELTKQPNILLILVDDLGYADLGCQGSDDIRTPHIDKLANSGIRFTAGYVPTSVCGPSRASLLTGKYSAAFGVQGNAHAEIGIPLNCKNMAEYLKSAGYSTLAAGKWHLGFSEDQTPMARGFDEFLGLLGGSTHFFPFSVSGKKWNAERNKAPTQRNDKVLGVGDLPPDTYLTDLFTDEAVRFIDQERDNPFFIYLSYNAPHGPIMAPDTYLDRNNHIEDARRRIFAGMMTALDDGVEKVIDALKRRGIYNETLVIFLSDNGGPTHVNTSLNTPFRGQKGDVLEGGIRVPYMISWPGKIEPAQISDIPVFSIDILPTLLAVANLETEELFDGVNLLPWLIEDEKVGRPHEDMYFWRAGNRAIRSGDIKLTNAQLGLESELYDIVDNYQENPDRQLQLPEQKVLLNQKIVEWENGWDSIDP